MGGAGDQARLRAGGGLEELGVEIGRRPDDEQRLLPDVRRTNKPEAQQEGPRQAQARGICHKARPLRRHVGVQPGQSLLIVAGNGVPYLRGGVAGAASPAARPREGSSY